MKAPVARDAGDLGPSGDEQEDAENGSERRVGRARVEKRPDQSTGGAGEAESPQEPPVDVPAQPPETNGCSNEVRYRDGRDGDPRAGVEGEERRQQAADAESADRGNGAGRCGDGEDNGNQKPMPTVKSIRRAGIL
jgi:hypothetical protein